MLTTALLLATVTGLSLAAPQEVGTKPVPASTCSEVRFTVSGTAQNRVELVKPDFSSIQGLIDYLTQPVQFQTVSGTETISGTYCRPANNIHSKTLQVLLHGNTYDRTYWTGFGSVENSWVDYFNANGYATLNIDRVGSGASSHPDPTTMVQAPYQVELLADLIKQLKNPRIGRIPSYEKIVVVGHSYGSMIGNLLAAKYPDVVSTYVLTGIAIPKPNQSPLPGQFAMGFAPASVHDPSRFPPAQYPEGYLTTTSKAGRMDDFYGNPKRDFNRKLYDVDYATEGTISTGEALTQGLNLADKHANPVFVLTGQQDAVFCGNGTRSPTVPDCGSGPDNNVASMKVLFPAVPEKDFGYYIQQNAGHSNGIHYTAKEGFKAALAFLETHDY